MQHVWKRAVLVVLGIAVSAGPADARARRPDPGTELDTAALDWPATTQSAEARGRIDVFRRAGKGRMGKLARGTRVAWKRIVASRDRCRAWLEIEPRGWVCARDVRPSDAPPIAGIDADRIVDAALAKEHAGVVPEGGVAWHSKGSIGRRKPKPVKGWSFLGAKVDPVQLAAGKFYKTRHGWIPAAKVEPRHASQFVGIDLVAAPQPWPFAWVTPSKRGDLVPVRATADAAAPVVRSLERRTVVAVHETSGRFARIGAGEWVPLGELRIARTSTRPRGVRADERWIDVDLDQQVLVAYDGDRPVYATMVSSGRGKSTPTAIHRIEEKRATGRMKSPEVALGKWDMPDVPFTMTFRRHYALHGVYWHDSFGKQRSQGCVNVSPRDARFLFDWTYPQLPPGWLNASAEGDSGTPIRLRNRRDPEPRWTDFHAEPPVPTRKTLAAAAAASGDAEADAGEE